jgi:type I restriction enzyme S subunit
VSRIGDLIRELCPKGVEFKAVGEIGELVRGNGMPRTDFVEAGVGAIHYGQIYTYYGTWTTETISFVAPATAVKLAKVDPGDVIITNTSENVDDVCKAVAWLGESQIVTGGHATVLKHDQDPKYLSYYLQTPPFCAQKKKHATGTKVIDVSAKSLARIRIPVPPLEVQREIARVLDSFQTLEAELAAELEAELEARRRQYAHYRDSLLAHSADVPRVALGDLGHIFRGRRFLKSDYVDDGLACIHYGHLYTDLGTTAREPIARVDPELAGKLRFARSGDLVIAEVGETVEDVAKAVAWLGREDVAIHDGCFGLRHGQNPVYLAYAFQTAAFHEQKNRHVARAKVKRLSQPGLASIRVPVPPLEEQERIVSILDSFDALVRDLSVGLPEELVARRRQYEHYRDRLLTFEEAA